MVDAARAPADAALPRGFLEAVERVVGARGWSIDPERIAPHAAEQWGTARGRSPLLLRPADVAELSQLLELCHAERVAVVPQGGNTGLVGAGVPDGSGRLAVLSLARLNRIREVDPLNDTITVEAGCVLETVQEAAAEVNRLFPLALGAQGSCQIGGNLSSNAGGTNVLRYGMARALVLGLEVVLADGRIWDGLRSLRKDNTGYDLKQLFIGAEGTLGVITAAVLRLLPRPRERQTAWLGVPSPQAAVALLGPVPRAPGRDRELVRAAWPAPASSSCCATCRARGGRSHGRRPGTCWPRSPGRLTEGLGAELERVLADALAQGLVLDGAIAASEAQRKALWALRENPTEAMAHAGLVLRHDVAVPVSKVPDLIAQGAAVLERAVPGVRIVPFGHVGDGNMHYNLLQPETMSAEAFRARGAEVQALVFDVVERARRQHQRRARHRPPQARRARAPQARARPRADARPQGAARPARHPQPRRGDLTGTDTEDER